MSLDTYVSVTITNNSPRVTRAGFGVPLLIGPAPFVDRVKTYSLSSALRDMVADGFDTLNPVYQAVSAMRNLSRSVKTVKIGRAKPLTQITVLTPQNRTANYIYSWTIGDETFTYTVDGTTPGTTDTLDVICAGMVTAVGSALGEWTATADPSSPSSTSVIIQNDDPGTYYAVSVDGLKGDQKGSGAFGSGASGVGGGLIVKDLTENEGWATDFADILEADSDWYYCLASTGSAAVLAVLDGPVAATSKKLLFMSSDSDAKDSGVTNDPFKAALTAGYSALAGVWTHRPATWPHALWAAFAGTFEPGAMSIPFKALPGLVGAPLRFLSESQKAALIAKSGNYVVEAGGVTFIDPGLASNVEYLDIVTGIDWTEARMQEAVVLVQAQNIKIPYTDAGIAVLSAAIKGVLLSGATNGLYLAESIVVDAPKLRDIDPVDRAARRLPNITWSAQFQGSIRVVSISGTVSA